MMFEVTKEQIERYNSYFRDSSGKFILDEYSKILIETTNHCNISACTFCAHQHMKRKKGFINKNLFEKIVKEAADFGFKSLDLRFYGEPLLDKGLEDKAKFASKHGFTNIMINTNGVLLEKKRFESLVLSGINEINFSISPKREYEATRPLSFDVALNNLKGISTSKYKDSLVVWVVLTNNTTEQERIEFDKLITELGLNTNYTKECFNSKDIWSEQSTLKEINHNIYCFGLFKTIIVNYDGEVVFCCNDFDKNLVVGDLNKESLKDVINSDRVIELRKKHLNYEFLDVCKKCDTPLDSLLEFSKAGLI